MDQSQASLRSSIAAQRMMRELKELASAPLALVDVLPLEADMFEHHANLWFPDGSGVVHVILRFSRQAYPATPPSVRLLGNLPHPNVLPLQHEPTYYVCCDMLNTAQGGGHWRFDDAAGTSSNAWSSAYSLAGILAQLHSLLCDPAMHVQGDLTAAKHRHARLACTGCPHSGSKDPWPAQKHHHEHPALPFVHRTLPRPTMKLIRTTPPRPSPSLVASPPIRHPPAAQCAQPSQPRKPRPQNGAAKEKHAAKKKHAAKTGASTGSSAADSGWTVVKSIRRERAVARRKARHRKASSLSKEPAKQQKVAAVVAKKQEKPPKEGLSVGSKAIPAASVAPVKPYIPVGLLLPATGVPSGRAGRRRRRRERIRQRRRDTCMDHDNKGHDTVVAHVPTATTTPAPVASEPAHGSMTPVKHVSKAKHASKTKHVSKAKRAPKVSPMKAKRGTVATATPASIADNMGPCFGRVSKDAVLVICRFLPLEDVLALGTTCKGLKQACDNWMLWHDLFRRQFPHVTVSGHQLDAWRWAYQMEAQGLASGLHCWYTRSLPGDDVLGLALEYTVNPRTELVDYVGVAPGAEGCFLSATAFQRLHVRTSPTGAAFNAWLPLYLDASHWQRCVPLLRRAVAALDTEPCRHWSHAAVRVLCKAMNTQVVLLADHGVAACDAALSTYTQLHRLLCAVCEEWSTAQAYVDDRVRRFMLHDEDRHKRQSGGLGDWLPLLCAASDPRWCAWSRVCMTTVREALARNVLWMGRHNSTLVTRPTSMPAKERLAEAWTACAVSNRLLAFHALFLRTVARPGLDAVARRLTPSTGVRVRQAQGTANRQAVCRVYDRFYGFVPASIQRAMRVGAQRLCNRMQHWGHWFRALGHRQAPLPGAVGSMLDAAITSSLRKGYHRRNTRFSAVHASGSSKVLRRGQSYTMKGGVSGVMLALGWTFPDAVVYLDASIILCCRGDKGSDAVVVDTVVDYQARSGANGSVVHSGDQIRHEAHTGEHNVTMKLGDIPNKVNLVYVVLSAWTTNFSAVSAKWVRLVDLDSPDGRELCSYAVEKADDSTAVIMACFHRQASGWRIQALGHPCDGRVGNYYPIFASLRRLGKGSNVPSTAEDS